MIATAIEVSTIISRGAQPFSELLADLERLPQVLQNVKVARKPPLEECEPLARAVAEAEELVLAAAEVPDSLRREVAELKGAKPAGDAIEERFAAYEQQRYQEQLRQRQRQKRRPPAPRGPRRPAPGRQ